MSSVSLGGFDGGWGGLGLVENSTVRNIRGAAVRSALEERQAHPVPARGHEALLPPFVAPIGEITVHAVNPFSLTYLIFLRFTDFVPGRRCGDALAARRSGDSAASHDDESPPPRLNTPRGSMAVGYTTPPTIRSVEPRERREGPRLYR